MNRIFTSGNYVIIDDGSTLYEYAAAKTVYTRRDGAGGDGFTIAESGVDRTAAGRFNIPVADVIAGNWFQEDGLTAYTEETLTTFLRLNTGNFNKAGSFESLTDVPAYATNGGKLVRVKVSEDGLEYFAIEDVNTWDVTGAAFVDPVNGNNSTAVVGNGNLPYQTITAAVAASDYVLLLPGTYFELLTVMADNKHVHALAGVNFSSGGFRVSGLAVNNFRLSGDATFGTNANVLQTTNTNANINFAFDYADNCRIAYFSSSAFGGVLNYTCNWIRCHAFNGGAYAMRFNGSENCTFTIKEFYEAQHTNIFLRSGFSGRLVFNCPNISTVPNYYSNYGTANKSPLQFDFVLAGAYVEINGNLHNGHDAVNTSAGMTLTNLVNGPFTCVINGNISAANARGIYSWFASAWGDFTINGDIISEYPLGGIYGAPIWRQLSGFGGASVQNFTVKNGTINGSQRNIIGRNAFFNMVNCTFNNLDATATESLFFMEQTGATESELYFYNCYFETDDAGVTPELVKGNAAAPIIGAVDSVGNVVFGATYADAWAGYSQIVGFKTPK